MRKVVVWEIHFVVVEPAESFLLKQARKTIMIWHHEWHQNQNWVIFYIFSICPNSATSLYPPTHEMYFSFYPRYGQEQRARTGQFEFIFLAGSFKMVSYHRGLFGRKLTPGWGGGLSRAARRPLHMTQITSTILFGNCIFNLVTLAHRMACCCFT